MVITRHEAEFETSDLTLSGSSRFTHPYYIKAILDIDLIE